MKISTEWLNEFVDLSDLSAEDFKELLTTKVAEVDAVVPVGVPTEHAIACLITKVSPHPQRESLRIATVNLGGEELQVVCGAPNCEVGMFTAYIPPSGQVVTGSEQELAEVGEREIAGVRSRGILVSERELGITLDHGGLFTFDDGVRVTPGEKLTRYLPGRDLVIVIDNKAVTHRPDLWGHYGFVRELAVILRRPLKQRLDTAADHWGNPAAGLEFAEGSSARFAVEVEESTGCQRFLGIELHGIKNGRSPVWMRRRLGAVGAGVRNVVVDLSNYVMWEVGQPNHTFDLERLRGERIRVRNGAAGERLWTLDGVERELTPEDVVVTDEGGALSLGGIIGGRDSAIQEETTSLFLEAATWDPGRIRLTAKRHQVRTDASNRYEKSQSPFLARVGISRFIHHLQALVPGVTAGRLVDTFVKKPQSITVSFSGSYIRSRLGAAPTDQEIGTTLTQLGFELHGEGSEVVQASVPYFRATRDVAIEDDLVEEVGRVLGYNVIPEEAPQVAAKTPIADPLRELEYRVRDLLSGIGFSEIYGYSFMDPDRAAALGYDVGRCVHLANPIDAHRRVMRTSLVFELFEAVERNSRYTAEILLFELGRSYHARTEATVRSDTPARERRLLSLSLSSGRREESLEPFSLPAVSRGEEFYALIGVVRRIARLVGIEFEVHPITWESNRGERGEGRGSLAEEFSGGKGWMHPGRAAVLKQGDVQLGVVAEVRPGVLDGVKERVVVAELALEEFVAQQVVGRKFKPLPKFPVSYFEMSVVMPEREPYSKLGALLAGVPGGELIRDVEVLSLYRGQPLQPGEKSVSVRLSLGAEDRTLGSEELSTVQDQLMAEVEAKYALRR